MNVHFFLFYTGEIVLVVLWCEKERERCRRTMEFGKSTTGESILIFYAALEDGVRHVVAPKPWGEECSFSQHSDKKNRKEIH